jgi:hypothetical protein
MSMSLDMFHLQNYCTQISVIYGFTNAIEKAHGEKMGRFNFIIRSYDE